MFKVQMMSVEAVHDVLFTGSLRDCREFLAQVSRTAHEDGCQCRLTSGGENFGTLTTSAEEGTFFFVIISGGR